jgi:hypothetical protein
MSTKPRRSFKTAKFRVPVAVSAVTSAWFFIAGSATAQITGFGGSSMTGWTPVANGSAAAAGVPSVSGSGGTGDVLTITNNSNSLATAYWFNTPQSISNFVESFTYQTSTSNPADGIAAVWQNQGTTALGAAGGGLGFTPGGGQSTGGLTSAAGLAINIFNGNPIGSAYNNTVVSGNPATVPAPGNVNVASGNPIRVTLSYIQSDGALSETMTNTVTNATFTRVWRGISIQGQVGGSTAFVGFTGATGGLNANQTITGFSFTPGAAVSSPATFAPIAVGGFTQNMIISASAGSANVTATMDGGVARTGDTFYEVGANNPTTHPATQGATASGVPIAGVFGSVSDANHAFVLQPNGAGQNDALMLDTGNTNGTLTLNSPGRFSALSFLVASGNGPSNINVTVHYADGSSQVASVPAPDWFNAGPIAWYAGGRVDTGLDDWNQELSTNPRMFQEDVNLDNSTSNVTSIDFGFGGAGGNREVVFAVSGTAVPEPSALALLSLSSVGLAVRRRRAGK